MMLGLLNLIEIATHEVSQDYKLNSLRAGSDEAKAHLKQLGADEVYTESQLEVKNVRGLLVTINKHFKLIMICVLNCLCSAILPLLQGVFLHFSFLSSYPPFQPYTSSMCRDNVLN